MSGGMEAIAVERCTIYRKVLSDCGKSGTRLYLRYHRGLNSSEKCGLFDEVQQEKPRASLIWKTNRQVSYIVYGYCILHKKL